MKPPISRGLKQKQKFWCEECFAWRDVQRLEARVKGYEIRCLECKTERFVYGYVPPNSVKAEQ